jgi:hypothetical protein
LLCVFLEIGTVTLAMKGMTWFGASWTINSSS